MPSMLGVNQAHHGLNLDATSASKEIVADGRSSMQSVLMTSTRCGEQYRPTCRPADRSKESTMIAVDPLPLVPQSG